MRLSMKSRPNFGSELEELRDRIQSLKDKKKGLQNHGRCTEAKTNDTSSLVLRTNFVQGPVSSTYIHKVQLPVKLTYW
jgi:hypothetical protein